MHDRAGIIWRVGIVFTHSISHLDKVVLLSWGDVPIEHFRILVSIWPDVFVFERSSMSKFMHHDARL